MESNTDKKRCYGITIGKTNWRNHDINFDNDYSGLTSFSRKILHENNLKWSNNVIVIRINSKIPDEQKKLDKFNNEIDKDIKDESQAYLIERYLGNKFGLLDS